MAKKYWKHRWRQIIQKLREKPLTVKELYELKLKNKPKDLNDPRPIPLRSLYRILEAMEYISLVYRGEDKKWHWCEEKGMIESQNYDAALKHSRLIIFGIKDKMIGIEDLLQHSILSAVPSEKEEVGAAWTQHLKTGYPDLYNLHIELQKFQEEHPYGFPSIQMLGTSKEGNLLKKVEELGEPKDINDKRLELASNYFAQAMRIVWLVKLGTPLRGYCDSCPTRYIQIKGKP
ncbi:MAG: hypothetical protein QXH91_08455 [Candidatus Bathyarchaeia archaeon]